MNKDIELAMTISRNKVYHKAIEAIGQALNCIPNSIGINDLNKVCNEINKIGAIVNLTTSTINSMIDMQDQMEEE